LLSVDLVDAAIAALNLDKSTPLAKTDQGFVRHALEEAKRDSLRHYFSQVEEYVLNKLPNRHEQHGVMTMCEDSAWLRVAASETDARACAVWWPVPIDTAGTVSFSYPPKGIAVRL